MDDRHYLVGTAGHVDHGKTELIRALSGIETDRLKEEKQRGISIELILPRAELRRRSGSSELGHFPATTINTALDRSGEIRVMFPKPWEVAELRSIQRVICSSFTVRRSSFIASGR